MQVHGPSQVHSPQSLKGPHSNQRANGTKPNSSVNQADQLDISAAADAAASAAESGEIRTDLVNRVRQEIANGTYETPEKLDAALDNFLDQIG